MLPYFVTIILLQNETNNNTRFRNNLKLTLKKTGGFFTPGFSQQRLNLASLILIL